MTDEILTTVTETFRRQVRTDLMRLEEEITCEPTQRERSFDFGFCTFAKSWYQKVNTQENKEPAICPKCSGKFDCKTILLSSIGLNHLDKKGERIQQIYRAEEDYTIYRTRQGVNVHFADCRAREREQRKSYSQLSGRLCHLRFLTRQMARWWVFSRFSRTGGFYDFQIAEAINLTLQKRYDPANEILGEGLHMAEEKLIAENQIRYLVACLLASVVLAGVPWLLGYLNFTDPDRWTPYLVAAVAGAVGAVFSIAQRVWKLDLKPCTQSVMNYVMGSLRVLLGFVAGVIILLIINCTMLGKGFLGLFNPPSMTRLASNAWTFIALAGFLGGFAERLVPSLLRSLETRKAIDDRGTPKKTQTSSTKSLFE
jgi:hypothetical protein